jgi:uncharacterized OB-fold protein
MKNSTPTPNTLCRNRHKPDAVCRSLKRCKKCGHALRFVFADHMCGDCARPTNAERLEVAHV